MKGRIGYRYLPVVGLFAVLFSLVVFYCTPLMFFMLLSSMLVAPSFALPAMSILASPFFFYPVAVFSTVSVLVMLSRLFVFRVAWFYLLRWLVLLFIWELGVYAISFFPVLGLVAVLGEGLLLGFIHFVLAHLFFRFSVAVRMFFHLFGIMCGGTFALRCLLVTCFLCSSSFSLWAYGGYLL